MRRALMITIYPGTLRSMMTHPLSHHTPCHITPSLTPHTLSHTQAHILSSHTLTCTLRPPPLSHIPPLPPLSTPSHIPPPFPLSPPPLTYPPSPSLHPLSHIHLLTLPRFASKPPPATGEAAMAHHICTIIEKVMNYPHYITLLHSL